MKLLHQLPPYNLFGIEDQDFDSAKVVAIPVPYDSTTSYKSGSRDGPHAIIEASRNIELYDEEYKREITDIGIYTTDEMQPSVNSPEETINWLEKECSLVIEAGKIPVIIGGEHSLAIANIRAIAKHSNDFSVIHFDAHSDYRDEYMGSRYSHACIMARAKEACKSCYSVGVRSIDAESAKKYSDDILYMKDMRDLSAKEIASMISKRTKKNIYITIDMDVLDNGEMPSVGTPEPNGIRFAELDAILKNLLMEKRLVGADFCELAPIPGLIAPNFLAAKLIFRALGHAFFQKKR
jgi:agmatinase